MATQVATALNANGKKKSNLASSVSQDLKSGKSGVVVGGGAVLGVGNGTSVHAMNNVERHHHEVNPNSRARAVPANNNNSNLREKETGDSRTTSFPTSHSSVSSGSMETGMLASHKVKHVGVGDHPPPSHHHHHIPQQQSQQPFNQFIQHQQQQRQIHNSQQSIHGGESGTRQLGGKENLVLVNQVERHQQQMLSKSDEDQPGKTEDRMDSRYDHASLGPTNNINLSQSGNTSVSEFNSYYGNGRGGPSFDQHGGQQSPGSGMMHSAQQNNMDQVPQNSHEGYPNNPYNHYPNYRPGYGNSGYGMMSPTRQGNNMMGPGSNTAATNHSKAAMAAASSGANNVGGFQRFPGQSRQHPSGATPTLNQLLTSPSPVMRGYGSGYPDYTNPSAQQQQQQSSMGLTKDMSSQYGPATHGWGGQQRNHLAMSPGNNGQGSGRSQVPPMDAMAMKRTQLYAMGNNPYSQQQQGGGGSYPGQPYGSPSPHRYPMGMPGRGQMGMSGMQYPQQQQQVAPQYGPQQGGFCQPQGQAPYFSPPHQQQQQQPGTPTHPPYMQPRPPPQQEVSQERHGNRGQSAMTPGKHDHDDRPSSLPCHRFNKTPGLQLGQPADPESACITPLFPTVTYPFRALQGQMGEL
ncbi:hypothetical protein DPEC_G00082960 [Dallia pectoralis]|uniref:Uncharacterized protein n=1 Tax=Dallia pectoralis TaxID=75939 RepID=A0ACC2GZZ0_DALPE|nr:hypothetical protein DPEC_G00082960 [Dallia pectoralis]